LILNSIQTYLQLETNSTIVFHTPETLEASFVHSIAINPTVVQVLKKCDNWERRTGYFGRRKKKVKMKFIYLDDAGNKLLHWLLLSLACWLMLARRLCAYNADLKVDTSEEILTVVMTSYYENIRSCKRHTVVRCVFCFWRFALLFLCLMTYWSAVEFSTN